MALFDLMFLYEIEDSETVFSISVRNCNEVFILIVLNLKMFLLEMSFHNTNLANLANGCGGLSDFVVNYFLQCLNIFIVQVFHFLA